jgi:hypothetical protein
MPIITSELMRVAQLLVLLSHIEAWEAGKEFIGLSKTEIVNKLGKPLEEITPDVWVYRENRQIMRFVVFNCGVVVSATIEPNNGAWG